MISGSRDVAFTNPQFEVVINVLVCLSLSASFEYLHYHDSTAIINMFTLSVRFWRLRSIPALLGVEALGGLVKLTIFPKIREKLGLSRPHPPTADPFFSFFLKHVQRKKHTKKNNISKKIKKSELGLDPPTHFRVFLVFLDFFKLDKTP